MARLGLYSEWYCMIGQKAAIAVPRRYSSAVGTSPLKPAISQLQKGMPEMPADSPARIEARKASQVEASSPAQWMGETWEPVKPARLKVTPLPAAPRVDELVIGLVVAFGVLIPQLVPRRPSAKRMSWPHRCSPPSVLKPSTPSSLTR
jgi:hypothetical protein